MNDRLNLRRAADSNVVVCALVTLVAGAYLAWVAWNGWIPFDDGMLAQTAQRVLEGQLPHRDFDDVYTGGLSLFHAAVFRVAGSSLGTLRATLLVATTASIPAWYYVAARFAPPLVAAVVTLTAIAWSVPNYPAAMPSWYNLILAICATAAMLRYIGTQRRRWIFVAGLCAGVSILVKIIGLYLVGALVLFLAFQWPENAAIGGGPKTNRKRAGALVLAIIGTGLTIAPYLLVRARPDARSVIQLATPPALLAATVLGRAIARMKAGWNPSIKSAVNLYSPLLVGIAVPVVLFAAVYWRADAVHALFRGVFVLPRLRFAVPGMHTPGGPPLITFAFALPIVLALTVATSTRFRLSVWHTFALICVCAAAIAFASSDHRAMVAIWLSARMLMLPIAVIVAVLVLGRPDRAHEPAPRAAPLVLVSCIAAWCSLVQFPFGPPIYFSYIAPLVILAATAVGIETRSPIPGIGLPLLLAYGAFAVAVRPQLFPRRPELSPDAARIDLPRGGIYVWPQEQRQYTELVSMLREHAGTSRWVLALPDVPEIYFLSGYENPTRAIYDVFEDSAGRDERLLRLIDDRQIRTVVINRDPQLSAPVTPALNDSLIRRFPMLHRLGPLEVRWR